jgi:hypothetical protein
MLLNFLIQGDVNSIGLTILGCSALYFFGKSNILKGGAVQSNVINDSIAINNNDINNSGDYYNKTSSKWSDGYIELTKLMNESTFGYNYYNQVSGGMMWDDAYDHEDEDLMTHLENEEKGKQNKQNKQNKEEEDLMDAILTTSENNSESHMTTGNSKTLFATILSGPRTNNSEVKQKENKYAEFIITNKFIQEFGVLKCDRDELDKVVRKMIIKLQSTKTHGELNQMYKTYRKGIGNVKCDDNFTLSDEEEEELKLHNASKSQSSMITIEPKTSRDFLIFKCIQKLLKFKNMHGRKLDELEFLTKNNMELQVDPNKVNTYVQKSIEDYKLFDVDVMYKGYDNDYVDALVSKHHQLSKVLDDQTHNNHTIQTLEHLNNLIRLKLQLIEYTFPNVPCDYNITNYPFVNHNINKVMDYNNFKINTLIKNGDLLSIIDVFILYENEILPSTGFIKHILMLYDISDHYLVDVLETARANINDALSSKYDIYASSIEHKLKNIQSIVDVHYDSANLTIPELNMFYRAMITYKLQLNNIINEVDAINDYLNNDVSIQFMERHLDRSTVDIMRFRNSFGNIYTLYNYMDVGIDIIERNIHARQDQNKIYIFESTIGDCKDQSQEEHRELFFNSSFMDSQWDDQVKSEWFNWRRSKTNHRTDIYSCDPKYDTKNKVNDCYFKLFNPEPMPDELLKLLGLKSSDLTRLLLTNVYIDKNNPEPGAFLLKHNTIQDEYWYYTLSSEYYIRVLRLIAVNYHKREHLSPDESSHIRRYIELINNLVMLSDYADGVINIISNSRYTYNTPKEEEDMIILEKKDVNLVQSLITSNNVKISDVLYGKKLTQLFSDDFNTTKMQTTCSIVSDDVKRNPNEMISIISSYTRHRDHMVTHDDLKLECAIAQLSDNANALNSLFGYKLEQVVHYINIMKSKGMKVGHIPINVHDIDHGGNKQIYQLQLILHNDMIDLQIVNFSKIISNRLDISIAKKVYLQEDEIKEYFANYRVNSTIEVNRYRSGGVPSVNEMTTEFRRVNITYDTENNRIMYHINDEKINIIDMIKTDVPLYSTDIKMKRIDISYYHDLIENKVYKRININVRTALDRYVETLRHELKDRGFKIGFIKDTLQTTLTKMPSVLVDLIDMYSSSSEQKNELDMLPYELLYGTDELEQSQLKVLNIMCSIYKRFISLDISPLLLFLTDQIKKCKDESGLSLASCFPVVLDKIIDSFDTL